MGDVGLDGFGTILDDWTVAWEESSRFEGEEAVKGGEVGRQIGEDRRGAAW
jgi:hypothetical protein